MQMMIEQQQIEYIPRHMRPMVIEVKGFDGLKRLVEDHLTDGMVYSLDMEVFTNGQKKK